MNLQDKVTTFISRAQSKICSLMLETSVDLNESYMDSEQVESSIELLDVIISLQDEVLDWTDKDIESVIDYYTWKENLADIAILSFEDKLTSIIVINNSQISNDWVAPFNALTLTVNNNQAYTISEVSRLDTRIDTLDFSALVPQELLDEVAANSLARHTHSNISALNNVTQALLNAIPLATSHRLDTSIHVTSIQKADWDLRVTQTQLTNGLALKAALVHQHAMSDVTGLTEAFAGLTPQKGDPGNDGITPTLTAGTVIDGTYAVNIDNTNPAIPILNFVIPKGVDGTDFHIDEYQNSSVRLSSVYNASPVGYSILGLDNGRLYFRKPFDSLGNAIPATTTSGWYSSQFMGTDGWSPMLGLINSGNSTFLTLTGWIGGSGEIPVIGTPGIPVYVGITGWTQDINEAINIRGPQGIQGIQGKVMFPEASDTLVNRVIYDDELAEFIFLDYETGLLYKKLSDTTADWSDGYQWRGDVGPQGEQGIPGTGGGGDSSSTWETNVAAIRALTDHIHGKGIGDFSTRKIYEYDSTSSSTDDGVLVLKPDDVITTGRWIYKITLLDNTTVTISNLVLAANPTNNVVSNSNGTGFTIPLADGTSAGLLKPAKYTLLEAITEAFTTALKSAYDGAVTWVSTNGSNLLNHLSNTSNPHSTTASQVGAVAINTAITGATHTKIAYDSKGLVTSGTDATTADVPDSTNKRYITDTQLAALHPQETATTIGALIGGSGDATPNDTDFVATSLPGGGILKKITWTNIKAFLKTYFDTFYASPRTLSTIAWVATDTTLTLTYLQDKDFATGTPIAITTTVTITLTAQPSGLSANYWFKFLAGTGWGFVWPTGWTAATNNDTIVAGSTYEVDLKQGKYIIRKVG